MIVSLLSTGTQAVYPSLATWNNLTRMVCYIVSQLSHVLCMCHGTGGESSKVTYDSGISSGPQGGMVTNRCKWCAILEYIWYVCWRSVVHIVVIPVITSHCSFIDM